MLFYKSLCLEYFLFTSAFAWPPLIHHSRFSPHVTDCRKPSVTITNFLIPSLYFYASLYLMFIYLMDWTESHGIGSVFVSSTTLSIHIKPGHIKCSTNASWKSIAGERPGEEATEGQCQGGGGTDIYPDGGGGYVILYICQTPENCLAQRVNAARWKCFNLKINFKKGKSFTCMLKWFLARLLKFNGESLSTDNWKNCISTRKRMKLAHHYCVSQTLRQNKSKTYI